MTPLILARRAKYNEGIINKKNSTKPNRLSFKEFGVVGNAQLI
jgi:hypothetical protein